MTTHRVAETQSTSSRIRRFIGTLLLTIGFASVASGCVGGGLWNGSQLEGAIESPAGGTLKVRIRISGEDLPVKFYSLRVTGPDGIETADGGGGPIEDSTRIYKTLTPGEYELYLSGLPENCRVTGPNVKTVSVSGTFGPATWTGFEVLCGPLEGGLMVIAETTSGEPSTGEYLVFLQGLGLSQPVPPNGSVWFEGLATGPVTVQMVDTGGCELIGSDLVELEIPFDGNAVVRFRVDCADRPADVAGLWWISTINTHVEGSWCDLYSSYDDPVTITQNGTALVVTGLEGDGEPWTGTVHGNVVTFGGDRPEPDSIGEATTNATYTLTVTNGANSVDGREDWDWTRDGADEPACWNGISTVSGFRVEIP